PLLAKTVKHACCLPVRSFRSGGGAGLVLCCCCGAPLFYSTQARGLELVESDWDFAAIITKQLAEWKRRGVGNSYQEALLKEVIELQTRALLRPISLPAEELQTRALLRPHLSPSGGGELDGPAERDLPEHRGIDREAPARADEGAAVPSRSIGQ
ncbi:unnamed protein product, partial [Ectocarpus sp. 12 AP-2014]